MEIYGLCLWHKSKFQPMCHDMGSACYSTLCRIVSDTTILQYSCVQYSCVEELVELLA